MKKYDEIGLQCKRLSHSLSSNSYSFDLSELTPWLQWRLQAVNLRRSREGHRVCGLGVENFSEWCVYFYMNICVSFPVKHIPMAASNKGNYHPSSNED